MKVKGLWILIVVFLGIGSIHSHAQIFPKIIKKKSSENPKTNPLLRDLRLFDPDKYLEDITKSTDSLLYKDYVDLKRRLSIVSEDTISLDWAPTNQLVQVSEQVLIDSIWVTAFEYYSAWDSKK